MAITVRARGDVAVVELSGEFTLGSRGLPRPLDLHGHRLEDFAKTLFDLLEKGRTRIVLDLDRVRFMDSAGLGELVAWKKRALQLGGDVRLLRPRGKVLELFELTALTRVFQIFDQESDAVGSFRPEASK